MNFNTESVVLLSGHPFSFEAEMNGAKSTENNNFSLSRPCFNQRPREPSLRSLGFGMRRHDGSDCVTELETKRPRLLHTTQGHREILIPRMKDTKMQNMRETQRLIQTRKEIAKLLKLRRMQVRQSNPQTASPMQHMNPTSSALTSYPMSVIHRGHVHIVPNQGGLYRLPSEEETSPQPSLRSIPGINFILDAPCSRDWTRKYSSRSNSAGGYALDHHSLPRIIAVHSVSNDAGKVSQPIPQVHFPSRVSAVPTAYRLERACQGESRDEREIRKRTELEARIIRQCYHNPRLAECDNASAVVSGTKEISDPARLSTTAVLSNESDYDVIDLTNCDESTTEISGQELSGHWDSTDLVDNRLREFSDRKYDDAGNSDRKCGHHPRNPKEKSHHVVNCDQKCDHFGNSERKCDHFRESNKKCDFDQKSNHSGMFDRKFDDPRQCRRKCDHPVISERKCDHSRESAKKCHSDQKSNHSGMFDRKFHDPRQCRRKCDHPVISERKYDHPRKSDRKFHLRGNSDQESNHSGMFNRKLDDPRQRGPTCDLGISAERKYDDNLGIGRPEREFAGPSRYLPVVGKSEMLKKGDNAKPQPSSNSRRNSEPCRSTTPPKLTKTIPEILDKLSETRERMKLETIDWKKKVLFRLERVLMKKLRRVKGKTEENCQIEGLPEEHTETESANNSKKKKSTSPARRRSRQQSANHAAESLVAGEQSVEKERNAQNLNNDKEESEFVRKTQHNTSSDGEESKKCGKNKVMSREAGTRDKKSCFEWDGDGIKTVCKEVGERMNIEETPRAGQKLEVSSPRRIRAQERKFCCNLESVGSNEQPDVKYERHPERCSAKLNRKMSSHNGEERSIKICIRRGRRQTRYCCHK